MRDVRGHAVRNAIKICSHRIRMTGLGTQVVGKGCRRTAAGIVGEKAGQLRERAGINLPVGRRWPVVSLRLRHMNACTSDVGRHRPQQRDAEGVEGRRVNGYWP